MKNKLLREANAVITLAMRDMLLCCKSPEKLVMALVMPVMFLGMFGGQLSQNIGINMDFDFNTFMLIGMMVQGLFMMMGNGIVSLVEDRRTDFTQEILVSPVSRYSIILGKIIGAFFVSYIQFFATIAIGYCIGARLTLSQFLLIFAFSPFICLAAGSFGVVCIGLIKKPSTAAMVIMMSSMAQTFLSGALIPVSHSTGIMAVLTRLLPMTYCVDFMRAMVYRGQSEYAGITLFPPAVDVTVIIAFTVLFLTVGTAGFVRAEKNR
jgi:ABC-2 type transport system permease protein